MSTLEAMREALGDSAEFQRRTMAYYRNVAMQMLQHPACYRYKADLFDAVRIITEWQRADTEDFTRFYEDYRTVTQRIDSITSALDALAGEAA